MYDFEPNEQQQKIIDWAKNGEGNMMVKARAGTGKTTTIEMIVQNISNPSLVMCFNKHIAEELLQRNNLERFVTKKSEGGLGLTQIRTSNSLGNATLLQDLEGKGFKTKDGKFLQENKIYQVFRDFLVDYCRKCQQPFPEGKLQSAVLRDLKTAYDKTKNRFYNAEEKNAEIVIVEGRLFPSIPLSEEDIENYPILPWAEIVSKSILEGVKIYEERGIYDFSDQLFIPVYKNLDLPYWIARYTDTILVDEAQDLTPLQIAFLQKINGARKMYKKTTTDARYCFVGDDRQAIYSFIGATGGIFDRIKTKFETPELPLTICYRCSKSVIRLAQEIVPDIEARPDAIEGSTPFILNSEICDYVKPNDMVIARRNRDLTEIFLDIIGKGKPVYIKDKDLVEQTIDSIERLGCENLEDLMAKITKLQKEYQEKMNNPENARIASAINNDAMDIYDIIKMLLDFFIYNKGNSFATPVYIFIDYLENLLVTSPKKDAIMVSSIHQVKGLEANNVFVINFDQMPYVSPIKTPEENEQEVNLKYVAITRAKVNLYRCVKEIIYKEDKDEDNYDDYDDEYEYDDDDEEDDDAGFIF